MGWKVLLCLAVVTFVTGCDGTEREKPALSEGDLVEVYVQMAIIRESDLGVVEENARIARIIDSTGVTWEEVNERISYYEEHPERWQRFYAKVMVHAVEDDITKVLNALRLARVLSTSFLGIG